MAILSFNHSRNYVNEEDSEIIEFPYMASYGYLEGNDDLLTSWIH